MTLKARGATPARKHLRSGHYILTQ